MKRVFLTFDDGPNEPYTSEILEVLKEFNAKATFFVCGLNVEREPESLKKIIQAGHTVGNHSYEHSFSKVMIGHFFEGIERTQEIIHNQTGVENRLYRSPWGMTMPWLRRKILRMGLRIYHWDLSGFDWWQPSPKIIAKLILWRVFPDAIILLHDGAGIKGGSREKTVSATRIILSELGRRGYVFESLS